MRLGGRLSAAIEILADIEARRRPVADALKDWGLSHRFAGSKDRAAIGNLVYDALRRKRSYGARMGEESPRALVSAAALETLPSWSGDTDGLRRTAELPSFRDAVAAIVAIADVAEEMDHHPDVDLRWRTLHLAVVTHSAGGVTALDLDLARRIDTLLPG